MRRKDALSNIEAECWLLVYVVLLAAIYEVVK